MQQVLLVSPEEVILPSIPEVDGKDFAAYEKFSHSLFHTKRRARNMPFRPVLFSYFISNSRTSTRVRFVVDPILIAFMGWYSGS